MGERELQVGRIVSMPFDENTYIAHFADNNLCIVIDPGLDVPAITAYLDDHSLTPAAFLCTHGHCDHIAGNWALKQRWPECPIVIGSGDAEKLTSATLNLSEPYGFPVTSPAADRTLREGEQFAVAGQEFDVLETPGHSVGHVVFLCRQTQPWKVFGGDVLFQDSVGRTDFPDCSFEVLRKSIHQKLFTLPDDTIVFPGHGPQTTIGREKRRNPFVGAAAGYKL